MTINKGMRRINWIVKHFKSVKTKIRGKFLCFHHNVAWKQENLFLENVDIIEKVENWI